MSRAGRQLSASHYYHIVLRGNNRQVIFQDDEDKRTFLRFLRSALVKYPTRLIAWCLMDNHVHLLIHDENRNLSTVIQSIASGYALYFNKRHKCVGHLFQDRFFSAPIENDRYLLEAIRYIHHNPAKARIAPHEEYPWSSYREYCGQPWIIDPEPLLNLLGDKTTFVRMHQKQGNTLPISQRGEEAIDDAEALETADEALKEADFSATAQTLTSLDKRTRDRAILLLSSLGIRSKQIERITGLSQRTILRIIKEASAE